MFEDLALWGFNLLALAYPHWQYAGPDDPAARKMSEHLRRMMRVAKQAGMRVTIGDALNGGFTSSGSQRLSRKTICVRRSARALKKTSIG